MLAVRHLSLLQHIATSSAKVWKESFGIPEAEANKKGCQEAYQSCRSLAGGGENHLCLKQDGGKTQNFREKEVITSYFSFECEGWKCFICRALSSCFHLLFDS